MGKQITIESGLRRFSSVVFHPVGRILATFLTPNLITTGALLLSGGVAYAFARGNFKLGGWLMFAAGLLDVFDGQVAKLTNRVTVFGAFFDSTVDRVNDFLYSFGAMYFFIYKNHYDVALLVLIYLIFSQLISYIKARAESLGFACNVGFLGRPLRMLLFGVSMFVYGFVDNLWIIRAPLLVIVALGFETAVHRFYHVWKQAKNAP